GRDAVTARWGLGHWSDRRCRQEVALEPRASDGLRVHPGCPGAVHSALVEASQPDLARAGAPVVHPHAVDAVAPDDAPLLRGSVAPLQDRRVSCDLTEV